MKGRRRARGVALITAMLITAMTGSLAAGLAWDNALDVRRTMVLLFHEQGFQVALGAESWIRNILRDDGIDSPTDHLGELWASDLPGLPVDNDSVQGAVVRQHRRSARAASTLTILSTANGEVDPDVLEQFQRLLAILDIDPRFAGLAADWIDPDQDAGIPDWTVRRTLFTPASPPLSHAESRR